MTDAPTCETRKRLVLKAAPLVSIALNRMRLRGYNHADLEDLRQMGMLALVQAAYRYDASLQVPFEAWVLQRVQGALLDGFSSLSGISRSQRRAIAIYQRQLQDAATGEYTPLPSCTGVVSGYDADEIYDMADVTNDELDPEERSARREAFDRVCSHLPQLPTLERTIIRAVYVADESFTTLSETHGVSRSWLSRVHARALLRLQELMAASYT